jgi:tRNA pseudouridine38-40 synthase
MKPYKIIIAYDGTDYHGWQEQAPGVSTIAGAMQDCFHKVFGHSIKVVGASRTDAGVHALGQVARFYTDLQINSQILLKAWNGGLPSAIHIRSLEPIIDTGGKYTFHPQHNVREKIYQYHFFVQRPLPFIARYGHFHPYSLDMQKMKNCLRLFVGKHDFASFCVEHCTDDTICTVDAITLKHIDQYNAWQITVKGKRFLHHMIRRMVGAALNIASHQNLSPELIVQALKEPGVYDHLPTAPAQGLLLKKIVYDTIKKEII